jgi:acetyltransferase-like isoleucine patch superfamily enzyme
MFIRNHGIISIGSGFRANSGFTANPIGGDTVLRLIVNHHGRLIIKDRVGISNSTIVCVNSVEIGNDVFIGGNCKIWDTDFHSLEPEQRIHNGSQGTRTAPIVIGDRSFIGGSTIILKGVSIGSESVIGAGSVVTKSVPAGEIWAGNPARFVRKLHNSSSRDESDVHQ